MSARLSAVRTTACSSQTKAKSILVDGEPMDRQVSVCWPSGEVQDLGLWPLWLLWAVGFMVSIWVFWGMPSFASFPVPFAAVSIETNQGVRGSSALLSVSEPWTSFPCLESGGAGWPVASVDSATTPSLRGVVT